MADEKVVEKKRRVTVKVPERKHSDGSTYSGFGSAGAYWTTGETETEVTEAQLQELKKDAKAGHPLFVIDHEEEESKARARFEKRQAEAEPKEAAESESKSKYLQPKK